jgi:hypothetical protein
LSTHSHPRHHTFADFALFWLRPRLNFSLLLCLSYRIVWL